MKKKRIAIIAVAAVAAAALLYGATRGGGTLTAASLNLEGAQVTRGDISATVHGTGTLEACEERDVYLQTGGRVETVWVEDGDAVEAGQLLFTLEDEDLRDQLRALEDELYQLELELSAAGIRDGSTTVRAPVGGRVKALRIDEGDDLETVQGQYGALMVISSDGRMNVTVPAQALEAGQEVRVHVDGKVEEGTVTSVADGQAVVTIRNDEYAAGETASVRLTSGEEVGTGALEVSKPVRITGVSGIVRRVSVEEGDEVDAGDTLFTLESGPVSLTLEERLLELEQKRRDVEAVRRDIENLQVRAPIAGTVDAIALYEGMNAQAGTVAATVLDATRMKVRLAVDELDIASVQPGQTAQVKLDALPGHTYQAVVDRVLPLGERTGEITRYDVLLYMDGQDGMLPQMSASGDIEVDSAQGTLLVPVAALQTVGEDYYVMRMPTDADLAGASVPRSQRANPFAQPDDAALLQSIAPQLMTPVQVGLVAGEQAQILSGLSESDEVVLVRSGNSLLDTMMSMRSM